MGEYIKNLDMMKASLGQKIQSQQLEIQMPIGSKQCWVKKDGCEQDQLVKIYFNFTELWGK